MNKKILVTGGAGMIGSALCHELENKGHQVTSLDNYSNGYSDNHHPGVEYITGCTNQISMYFHDDVKFDYIFHLGEYARVEQSFDDYDTVMEYNYHSFPKMLEFAKKSGAKFIYSGSSTKFSIGEDGKAMSPYAYTKAQNTELLNAYASWNNLPYAIVYFYNVYGEGEVADGKYATVIAKFIKMVKEGATSLPITSPGTQERNFTHIDDTVDGLIRIMEFGAGDNWGIGNDTSYSLLDIAEMLGVDVDMKPEKPGNRMGGVVHNTMLKALGWKPKTDLKNYIKGKL
jgi:UDP-glucose 4-epimerase